MSTYDVFGIGKQNLFEKKNDITWVLDNSFLKIQTPEIFDVPSSTVTLNFLSVYCGAQGNDTHLKWTEFREVHFWFRNPDESWVAKRTPSLCGEASMNFVLESRGVEVWFCLSTNVPVRVEFEPFVKCFILSHKLS